MQQTKAENGMSNEGVVRTEADLFSQPPLVPKDDKRVEFMPHPGFGHLMKPENNVTTNGYRLDSGELNKSSSTSSPSQPSLNMALETLPYSPSFATPVDGKKLMGAGGASSQSHLFQCSASSILQKPSKTLLATPPGTSKSAQARIGRPPVEGRGKGHLLPRYWPKYTDKELQQISGKYPFSLFPNILLWSLDTVMATSMFFLNSFFLV